MSETQTKVENTNKWQFRDFKRWEITGSLTLRSPLHIGDGGTIEKKIKDRSGAIKEVQVNSVITGKNHHPVIPGSTLKGRLRHYFSTHLSDHTLLDQVFGRESGSENDPGHGGLAEFHDANLDQLYQNTCIGYYPHWDDDRKTFIETSTAINRHTRTAMDGSLYYTECVQPGAVFNIKITGSMQDSHAALVVAALEAIRTESNRFCLGAEDAAGKGRVGLTGRVCVKLLDQTQMMDWLEKDSSTAMATSFYRELDEAEIRTLINDHMEPELKPPALPDRTWDLVLHFDGPFVVNDPERCREDDAPNVYPLTGSDGNPILPVRSFKGSIRSQAERIIRTLGGQCCDGSTGNGCKGPDNLCIACEMFGSTGWKTSLEIDPFIYMNKEERRYITQDFVAIDRFHGGGADGAKFNAKYSLSPVFKSSISISNRIGEDELSWRKGLLSLLFRDLADGDIYLGFGMNKGYGAVKKADITCNGQPFSVVESDIKAFHDKCRKTPGSYGCDPVKTPEINAIKNDSPPIVPLPAAHSKFYNPYHFIPVKKPNTEAWTEKNKYGKEKSPHSHGFYRKTSDDQTRLYHGRIICRLTSETPFFIGAGIPKGQKGNKERNIAALKENYRLNGKLAIPATSLRGMISSLAEAASNSAMRVMDSGIFLPDENLLPFNRNRNRISPAELLFGFTENSKKEDENDHGLAFAGKLRISAGTLRPKFSQKSETDLLETEVHLKALAAPKPPCPAFYFKDKKTGEAYIEKPNLNAGIHGIQGRKMYLHAMREPEDSSRVQKITSTGKTTGPADQMTWPWIGHLDERNHLKTRCRPVASDIEFFFHLDFNNLSPWEIGLLCYALRPGDTFRHKIGMGKPIGLGTVKIDIAALQTIDRQARYNDSAQNTERYNEGAWVDKKLEKQILELYGENGISSTPGKLNPQDCKKKFTETMDTDIARAIELLGNPGHVKNPVHYPQVNDENIEKENFKWFERNATNEEHGKQRLKPITNGTTHLDLLNR